MIPGGALLVVQHAQASKSGRLADALELDAQHHVPQVTSVSFVVFEPTTYGLGESPARIHCKDIKPVVADVHPLSEI